MELRKACMGGREIVVEVNGFQQKLPRSAQGLR
jgi:hypothetical protein